MGKIDWHPWSSLEEFRERMDRLLREAVEGVTPASRLLEKGFVWVPAADVIENAESFVIQVELPGFSLEDVSVEINGDDLWILGERPFRNEEGQVYQVLERSYGQFARKFSLPRSADTEHVSALLKDGLLILTVRKRAGRDAPRCSIDVE
jgi:HSP20 family protein